MLFMLKFSEILQTDKNKNKVTNAFVFTFWLNI